MNSALAGTGSAHARALDLVLIACVGGAQRVKALLIALAAVCQLANYLRAHLEAHNAETHQKGTCVAQTFTRTTRE
jgi:hypothetical protein